MRPTPTNEWGGSDSQRAEWTSARIARLERDRAELIEALRKAIASADGWADDSWGVPCPDLDAERALLARLESA